MMKSQQVILCMVLLQGFMLPSLKTTVLAQYGNCCDYISIFLNNSNRFDCERFILLKRMHFKQYFVIQVA